MDDRLGDVAKGGQKGLLLLAELHSMLVLLEKWATCILSNICTKLNIGKRQKLEFNG